MSSSSSSSSSLDNSRIISCPIILVEDVKLIENYLVSTIGDEISSIEHKSCAENEINYKPLRHSIVNICNQKIMLIQKSFCEENIITLYGSLSVKHIFLSVKHPDLIQEKATSIGAQVCESNLYQQGNIKNGTYCIIDGPEGIKFYIFDQEYAKTLDTHEFFMSTILNQIKEEDRDSSIIKTNTKNPSSSSSPLSSPISSPSTSPNRRRLSTKTFNTAPPILTLEARILSNLSKNFVSCIPNARIHTEFETNFFKGSVCFAVKLNPEDKHYECFFRGKKTFEVQVQGKFKRVPLGEVYCGAEASTKMELGIITRSISKAVCNFAGTMIDDLHYSFGDSPTTHNHQIPHLVAPLFSTMDKIVVTPPGKDPPPLGIPFVEDPIFAVKRLKFKSIKEANIDINNIYSFSVNTANIDLPNWNIIGIPMKKSMDMRTFFGDSSIHLVCYEIPDIVIQNTSGNVHPAEKLNYVFQLKLSPIDAEKVLDLSVDQENEDDDREDGIGLTDSNMTNYEYEEEIEFDDEEEDQDFGVDEMIGVGPLSPKIKRFNLTPIGNFLVDKSAGAVSRWFKQYNNIDIPETAEYMIPDYEMESTGDFRYCAVCIEINNFKIAASLGRRRTLFVMPWSNPNINDGTTKILIPRLRSYEQVIKIFPMVPIPKLHKNVKMSIREKRRRHIAESYKALLLNGDAKSIADINSLLGSETEDDRNFLTLKGGKVRSNSNLIQNNVESIYEGCVSFAASRRVWVEAYAFLSNTDIIIKRTHLHKLRILRIPIESVIFIRPMTSKEIQISAFSYFQIETVNRIFYFMISSALKLEEWMNKFHLLLGAKKVNIKMDYSINENQDSYLEILKNISEDNLKYDSNAYLPLASESKLDKRRIFNNRSIIFNPNGIPDNLKKLHPCELCERILTMAFDLSLSNNEGTFDISLWILFMNEISVLQVINITLLKESERAAFLLNLYHIIVLHGSVIIGPPPSWSSWKSFFNTIAYTFAFDIVSLVEIEHNMLRAAMSRPSPLLSKMSTPTSQFPGVALTQPDFRLNFCINSGSRSMPKFVPIYKAITLDRQLDQMTQYLLLETVEIDSYHRAILLPKVCSLFLSDFSSRNFAIPLDSLRVISHYLRGEDKQTITRLLSDGVSPSVKFKNYNYRCRAFVKMPIDTIDEE